MLTPERWQKVKDLLATALEMDSAARSKYLDQACANDPPLRSDLDCYLAADQEAGVEFLNTPAPAIEIMDGSEENASPRVGRRVGPYQIVEEIGAGGMGEVYRAFRADDQYRKQVAIKLVRAGHDSSFVVSRFKNERQILASLDHPNIARLHDGGTTEDGLPYFVMELIDGQPIDQYCARRGLSVSERLKLFMQVCTAVQYAHQRLVIHRDIKPGNILVASDGTPKLLDFGIAKILDPEAGTGQIDATLTVFRVLTPGYASPEQVKGEPITTASDVYSLGVVLYELLTGSSPYQLTSHKPQYLVRAVCELEPERPSTALLRTATENKPGTTQNTQTSIGRVQDGSLQKRSKRLSGDLDNIVLMALRKEPQRRYASVEQFSQDIRRHLEHLPVVARKDTFAYRTSKFIARHKAGVTVAVLVTIVLLSSTGITIRQARIARAERARAERRFNDVRRLANSLMFEVHDSIQDLPGATAARKLIIQRAQEYLDGLVQESQSDPVLLRELALAYGRLANVQGHPRDANIGDTPRALQNARKAVELLEAALVLDPLNRDIRRELAESKINLSYIQSDVGDTSGVKQSLDEAVQSLEKLAASNPKDLKIESDLADAYSATGFRFNDENDLTQGLTYHKKALAVYQQLAKADPRNEQYQTQLSFSYKRVASVLIVQNQVQPAFEHEQAALAIDEAQLALHPDNARTRYNITFAYGDMGFILKRKGDYDGAAGFYRKALAIRAALAAADPLDTRARRGLSTTYLRLGGILEAKRDIQGALDSYKRALALIETLSPADPTNESLRNDLANTQLSIADLYASMSFKSHVPALELQYCREAETWYQRGLPFYLQRKAQGKQAPDEARGVAESVQNKGKCGRIIARLDHVAESTHP